jgi:hypothetical protein
MRPPPPPPPPSFALFPYPARPGVGGRNIFQGFKGRHTAAMHVVQLHQAVPCLQQPRSRVGHGTCDSEQVLHSAASHWRARDHVPIAPPAGAGISQYS